MHDQPMVGRSRLKATLISFGVFIFVSWIFEHIAHRETFEAALKIQQQWYTAVSAMPRWHSPQRSPKKSVDWGRVRCGSMAPLRYRCHGQGSWEQLRELGTIARDSRSCSLSSAVPPLLLSI